MSAQAGTRVSPEVRQGYSLKRASASALVNVICGIEAIGLYRNIFQVTVGGRGGAGIGRTANDLRV